jgi:hypothetical protein
MTTIQLFLAQILHGNTACTHLRHLTKLQVTASAYCQARMKLPRLCRKFCAGGHEGQLSLSVGGLRGQGVEQFGRSEALVSSLDPQLFLFDHMHELDPNEGILGCLERFEPQHGPCHPFYCAMILLHNIV